VPPGQRLTNKFPVLHYGSVPMIKKAEWKFSITGLVEKERTMGFDEFDALPKIKVVSDIHCVTHWSKLDVTWEGVSTQVIHDLVKIKPAAKFVMVHAAQDFATNLSLDDFFEDDVVFAIKYNNGPLTPEHGYPVRLVVPKLYFWKSAKWVTGLEFIEHDRLGFWESHGYHAHGDPWKEERYS
jgi:DMSO/TMAO reductase YedYZ molybdopterin-dependent catalytic subunit